MFREIGLTWGIPVSSTQHNSSIVGAVLLRKSQADK